MKKLLYLSFCDFENGNSNGVVKKILDQSHAFNLTGYDTTIGAIKSDNVVIINNGDEKFIGKTNSIIHKRISHLNILKSYLKSEAFDAIYIRYPLCDYLFLNLLKSIRHRSNAKIVVEIPTYPYKAECMALSTKILLLMDQINNRRLKKYVDRIATFSTDEEIFGIQTLKIINGIDFSITKCKRHIEHHQNKLNIIAVASMFPWHGYDRFIKGLYDYYKKNDINKYVFFHLVGEGSEIPKYKELVYEYGLGDYVVFHGAKFGDELDYLYEISDLAIECLGAHRKKLFLSSSLKSREYSAKGLPIITSCEIDAFPSEQYDFVLKIPEDESNVNIQNIVDFYDDLKKTYESIDNLTLSIRKMAENKCDIMVTVKPIIDFFNSEL
jgi:glycosyltransferase involved in cell wall biosynthesis